MLIPQTRNKKIQLLKEVTKGNFSNLNAIAKEQKNRCVSGPNIILSFYYLLEHGRPEGYSGALKYDKCYITSIADLKEIENGITTVTETGSYDSVPTGALIKLEECMECYLLLKAAGQAPLLKKYQHHLKQYDSKN